MDKLIVEEFNRRVFEESYERIFKCLSLLSEDEVWLSPNKNTNSIGNLILHLNGNVRQWMISTFTQTLDNRERSEEFKKASRISKNELKALLLQLKVELEEMLSTISEKKLIQGYEVQVYKENGVSIFIHVIEHFSYHTGQIAFLTKLISDKDLEFYPYSLE